MTQDVFISDFTSPAFQDAFRAYFAELGINVKDWDSLFCEMNDTTDAENHAYVRLDKDGRVIGFIQFCSIKQKSWFFEETYGFIREFWVRKEVRNAGHGSDLLHLAEEHFLKQGIIKSILTTDTAPLFYEKQGYRKDHNIRARNEDEVFVKAL